MQRTKPARKKRISTASAKQKGRELQKWVAAKISEVTGLPHGKDTDIESRPMGQSGTDIRLSKEAIRLFNFSVECKRQETWAVPAWIEQAKKNCLPDTDWLLVLRRSHSEPVVVMDAGRFFELLRKKETDNGEADNVYVRPVGVQPDTE